MRRERCIYTDQAEHVNKRNRQINHVIIRKLKPFAQRSAIECKRRRPVYYRLGNARAARGEDHDGRVGVRIRKTHFPRARHAHDRVHADSSCVGITHSHDAGVGGKLLHHLALDLISRNDEPWADEIYAPLELLASRRSRHQRYANVQKLSRGKHDENVHGVWRRQDDGGSLF